MKIALKSTSAEVDFSSVLTGETFLVRGYKNECPLIKSVIKGKTYGVFLSTGYSIELAADQKVVPIKMEAREYD